MLFSKKEEIVDNTEKRLYRLIDEGRYADTLYLSEDQAAVFKYINFIGYDLRLEPADDVKPLEIVPKEWKDYIYNEKS